MIDNIGELIFVQGVYIVVLLLVIVATHRLGRKGVFYLIIAGLYVLTLIWLIYEYINFGINPDPGVVVTWGMLSMIVPGILTFSVLIVFIISRMVVKRKM